MPSSENGQASPGVPQGLPPIDLRAAWIAEVDRVAARRRWGPALLAVAGIHLGFSLGLQTLLWSTGGLPRWPYPVAWLVELTAVFAAMRAICGRGWLTEPGMAGVVVRVWGTFFILSFNMASNNQLTGWELNWFKTAWCTLATFGLATMAWLFSLRFLIPAVGFYFLGLLAARFPDQFYLLHGLSWGVTLVVVGRWLDRRRRGPVAQAAWSGSARPGADAVWPSAPARSD